MTVKDEIRSLAPTGAMCKKCHRPMLWHKDRQATFGWTEKCDYCELEAELEQKDTKILRATLQLNEFITYPNDFMECTTTELLQTILEILEGKLK